MKLKAIFLDFYGTLVHEDDEIIPLICEDIKANSGQACTISEIAKHWWSVFSPMCQNSFGETFKSQRELGLQSLAATIKHFHSHSNAHEIIQQQFNHWMKPTIYADTLPFMRAFAKTPLYIVSNIDTADVLSAIAYHRLPVAGVLTSEDVKAYKPKPELFLEALRRYNVQPDEVVHIGDSYTNDVKGASRIGINTVWLNRLGKVQPAGIEPDYICRDMLSVQHFLLRDFEWD